MELPDGYRSRGATADDVRAVADLLADDDLRDAGEIVLDADFVRAQWSSDRFDLASDAWVVVGPAGDVIGYAHAMHDGPDVVESWGVVRLVDRGRGVGTWLVDRVEHRAAELLGDRPDGRFRHAIDAKDEAAAGILRARGLRPVRHFWHMAIDLDGQVERHAAPRRIRIAPPDGRQELAAVHAILDEAFAEDWGYRPEPLDRWLDEHAHGPEHDPSLWLLATVDGEPVGALTASLGEERGWIDELGVRAEFRGHGIGTALLRRSFTTLAARGLPRVMLNVDAENPTGATALYERVGMRIVKRWDLWEKPAAYRSP